MKKKMISTLLLGCILTFVTTKAQEKNLDCKQNMQDAINQLKKSEKVSKDTLKALEYLKPCVEAEFSNAQLLMGRILLSSKDDDDLKRGFKLIKKAAKQGNGTAACDLAILFKYGRGCDLNLNKAEKWFIEAANLGNEKAAYSLGYIHFKGLGTISQDYIEAVKWFEKSNYSMSKYWLGICYYNGYGVTKNIEIAEKLFNESELKLVDFDNGDSNSSSLEKDTTSNNLSKTLLSNNEDIGNDDTVDIIENFDTDEINGQWIGSLNILDWSGSNIEYSVPVNLKLEYDKFENTTKYIWNINKQEITGRAINESNVLYYDGLYIDLNHNSFIESIPKNINYQILSSKFILKSFDNKKYLTASIESYINQWKESGAPISLVLTKKGTTNNGETISDEALLALSSQTESFIKLYPNPFIEDLLIGYNLKGQGSVQIEVSSINGAERFNVESSKLQKAGEYTYHFNGSQLKKGIYAVTIIVDGVRYNKLIIKE